MGTLGEYDYPDITISQAIEIARTIEERNIERMDVLANALGHKGPTAHRGGAFRSKVAALARYSLLTGRSIELRLSDLAKRIIHFKSEGERDLDIAQAVLGVPLLAKIHEKLRGDIPEDFWAPLYDCTGVDQKLVKEHAAEIRKLYADSVRYLSQSQHPAPKPRTTRPESVNQPLTEETEEDVPDSMMSFKSGAIHVKLPVSPQNVKVLIHLLESLAPSDKSPP